MVLSPHLRRAAGSTLSRGGGGRLGRKRQRRVAQGAPVHGSFHRTHTHSAVRSSEKALARKLICQRKAASSGTPGSVHQRPRASRTSVCRIGSASPPVHSSSISPASAR